MDKKTLLKLVFSGFLVLALIFAGYYKIELARKSTIIAQIEPDNSCDLQVMACTLAIPGGGEVTLNIQPRPIPLVQKFNIDVQLNHMEAEAVSIDFKGTTMNMGPNNVKLQAQTAVHYSGQGMLPVCIRNSMEWQADVYIQTHEGIYIAPFIFVTSKH